MKNGDNAWFQTGHLSCTEKQNFKSGQSLTFRIDLFFIPSLHDFFKSISFLNRTSVWQAFQGARKIEFSRGYSIVVMSFFAKEVATASGKTRRGDVGLPHTSLNSFAVPL